MSWEPIDRFKCRDADGQTHFVVELKFFPDRGSLQRVIAKDRRDYILADGRPLTSTDNQTFTTADGDLTLVRD